MKIVKKVIVVLLSLLLVTLLVSGTILYVVPVLEKNENKPTEDDKNWMSKISDDTSIAELYIPGSHDAATAYIQLPYFARCQSLNFREQLESGVRYLDIRLGIMNDNGEKTLGFYHGFTQALDGSFLFAKKLNIKTGLNMIYNFLHDYPSETVIFNANVETNDSIEEVEHLLHELILMNSSTWLLVDYIPKLEECRGKIVLLRRFIDESNLGVDAGLDAKWDDQGGYEDCSKNYEVNNKNNYNLVVQDRYEYIVEEKYQAFKASPTNLGENDLYINFLSTKGHAKFGHPYKFAKELNQMFLDDNSSFARGIYCFDFINSNIASKIYNMNF